MLVYQRVAVHIQGVFRWHLVVRDHEATKKGLVGCSPMEMATRPNLISGVIFDAQTAWSNVWRPKWEAWKHAGCLIMIDYVGTCGNQLMLRQTTGPKNGSYGPLQIAGADTPRNTTGHRRRAMDPNAQSFASVLQRCSKMFKWFAKPLSSFRPR